jgi:uncharacterized pyridoxamine 5'-phosphate oxidase family protein
MTKNEIFEAITKNPVFHLATVEGDQPHVRAMFLYKADETGILFHTGTVKNVYKQIIINNKAELSFSCNGTQIRITGELELIDDNSLKDEILEHPTRGFLRAYKEKGMFKDFYKDVAVFRMKNGVASPWTMDKNFSEKEIVYL